MRKIVFIIVFTIGSLRMFAATQMPAPEKGFWEIITNVRGPARTTVKFFDLEQHLIYVEHLDGVRLDGRKKKVCKMLNKSLETALVAWRGRPMEDRGIVAMLMR